MGNKKYLRCEAGILGGWSLGRIYTALAHAFGLHCHHIIQDAPLAHQEHLWWGCVPQVQAKITLTAHVHVDH